MTEELVALLARRMGAQCERVGSDLRLRSTNPEFWRLLGEEPAGCRPPLTEVFPELVGLEDEIGLICAQGCGEVTVPLVNRGNGASAEDDRYLDVTLLADRSSAPDLLLIVADVTERSRQRRGLLQSRNENALLQRELGLRNERLRAGARRLAAARRLLREQNGELERLNAVLRDHSHALESAVRERTAELRETRLEIIRRLALAAESRDSQAKGHISRMSRYSVMLARALGMSEKEREVLYHASLLHDVGKIAIPDRILQKPGPLLPEERAEMRLHAGYGAELLGGSGWDLMRAAATIARSHHERWDGHGYPDGLAGAAIPLLGRICALADVFDALTTARPYKAAWSIDEAVAEIEREKGRAFDPGVVQAFMDVLPDFRRIKAHDGDNETGVEDLPRA